MEDTRCRGRRERKLIKKIELPPEITSAELKYSTSWKELIQGFGQASAFKLFSHRSYLVIPKQTRQEYQARLDKLCLLFGIGFVLYDADPKVKPKDTVFEEKLRPQLHDPEEEELDKIDEDIDWDKLGRTIDNYLEDI